MNTNSIKRWIRYSFSSAETRRGMDAKRAWRAADGDYTLRLRYSLHRESVVIDVGGYRGQWTSDIYSMYRCKVHIFEPIPRFADFIAKRFDGNPDITLHRVALGTENAEVIFEDADDSTGRLATSGLHGSKTVVQTRAASSYFSEHGIEHVDLMKLNIEGDEYDLLEHLAASGAITDIANIQVQFHPFVADADVRLRQSHELLSRTHRPTYQFRYIWENWQRK